MRDPEALGREVAELFLEHEPRLFAALAETDVWQSVVADPADAERAPGEWQAFALYACVRGIVAGGGFNRETVAAIDSLHDTVAGHWQPERDGEARRARLAERYAEYGAIGQAGGASGAESVTRRLGEAAARHMTGADPPAELANLVGDLHESLAEAIAEHLRSRD